MKMHKTLHFYLKIKTPLPHRPASAHFCQLTTDHECVESSAIAWIQEENKFDNQNNAENKTEQFLVT